MFAGPACDIFTLSPPGLVLTLLFPDNPFPPPPPPFSSLSLFSLTFDQGEGYLHNGAVSRPDAPFPTKPGILFLSTQVPPSPPLDDPPPFVGSFPPPSSPGHSLGSLNFWKLSVNPEFKTLPPLPPYTLRSFFSDKFLIFPCRLPN